ncbi:hypothetical protein ACOSQ4_013693 [Xanthoceras sorbifolium]
MKVLKGYVKNRTRPKGCIAERYLLEEYTLFCSKYFKQASEIIDEIKCNASCVSNTLKWFANGPRDLVMSFNGYIINGLRFHTKEAEKSRQNSGVLVEATTLCRSSARDNTQILGQVAYYGRLWRNLEREAVKKMKILCEEDEDQQLLNIIFSGDKHVRENNLCTDFISLCFSISISSHYLQNTDDRYLYTK